MAWQNDPRRQAQAGYDGLRVRSQRGTESIWTELGTDMNPPFVDNDAVSPDWSATLTVIAHNLVRVAGTVWAI